jgi:hypothetical protein
MSAIDTWHSQDEINSVNNVTSESRNMVCDCLSFGVVSWKKMMLRDQNIFLWAEVHFKTIH